jgi:alpha-galactosidase
VVFYFIIKAAPNPPLKRLKLRGLDKDRVYTMNGAKYHGSTLMNYGIPVESNEKDLTSYLFELRSAE